MMEQFDRTHALRLISGMDLKNEITQYVFNSKIKAGWINTCVGSLIKYNMRFTNQKNGNGAKGFFEIISLTGTLSINGCHLHICISGTNGKTIGGHLLEGCKIYTTAEIILSQSSKNIFNRVLDETTGFKELDISEQ